MSGSTVRLDHLVVAAATLADGVAWCESVLGITPGPGGRHALMGTHNRLFSIASPGFPRAYFEVIAIDPQAEAPSRARWFDLDSPQLQAAVACQPQLVHWVVRCDDLAARCERLRQAGADCGEVLRAERESPAGTLRWRISVRPDGMRLYDGVFPTLIEWGDVHPADAMPASAVTLQAVAVAGIAQSLWREIAPDGVQWAAHGPALQATLDTPRGRVSLRLPPAGRYC